MGDDAASERDSWLSMHFWTNRAAIRPPGLAVLVGLGAAHQQLA